MEDSIDINDQVFFEDSTKVKCEDSKDGILDGEFAVDIRKIQMKEEIYVWNSFESAQAGTSTDCLTQGNAASMESYECAICWREFVSSRGLRRHLVCHKKGSKPRTEKKHQCQFCDAKFPHPSYLKTHLTIHTGEKPYQCDGCSARFNRTNSLKLHIRFHVGETPFECQFCDGKFNQKFHLVNHLRIHTGEKPYQCRDCSAKFADEKTWRNHALVHKGEKPFKCGVCSAKFAEAKDLRLHVRLHTRKKQCQISDTKSRQKTGVHFKERYPYECEVCDRRWKNWSTYSAHKTSHSGEAQYECELCKEKFFNTNRLNNHIRMVHLKEKNPYLCQHCQVQFWLSDNYKTVIKILGGITTTSPAGETCSVCNTRL